MSLENKLRKFIAKNKIVMDEESLKKILTFINKVDEEAYYDGLNESREHWDSGDIAG